MNEQQYIFDLIKKSVKAVDPGATLILYGSYARGDYSKDSDIDLLILLDRDRDKISYDEEKKITDPLYALAFETGIMLSPVVYTTKGWANHRVTPYYENVNREGVIL